ncbi:endochitinase A1-like [Haliotis rufescens]|uniref:endochitinase A1-like n=1 Tax=Haliotis rufescens TaxID=6454 RepID=UPI00201F98A6|nr:endochitinase A1-like [Haliotis rufescens]
MERNDIEEHEYQELFSISRSPPSQQIINDGSGNDGQQHQAADNTVTIIQGKEASRALYITLIVAVIIIISLVVLICVIVVVFIPTKAPAGATTGGNGKVTVSTTTPAGTTTAAPARATTTDPFSCESRATGDNIPREYTHPSYCKEYYWCVNGAPYNRTCQESSFFIANATPVVACTSDYTLSFCALKSSSSPPAGATTAAPARATTTDPFSCESRATGDNIPREYTHPSYCKEYYWCVNGAPYNRTCQESSFFIANATPVVACTSDYTLSFCALKSSSSPPAGATTASNGKVTVSTTTAAGATTADPFSCESRATGDNIPREYTHPSHCKEYYWCVNGTPINRTCWGSSFFIANATQSLACTSDYTLSFCALKSSSSPAAGATTADPFSCESRATGDNIPREYTHPSHCKEYYWCVNGTPINRTCWGSSFFIANATQSLACTSDYTLSFCALKSSSSPPAGATTTGNGKVTVSTTTAAGATTADPFSCESRATGDNIPREYTHPSHCKEYYWCVNGTPINRTCWGSSFFIANATQSLACTSDYTLSFCALKSSSSPPAGATTTAPPSKCDCSTYAYIARANTYPGNCSQYYWCVNGVKYPHECGPGLQVQFHISEDAIPCTNIPSDYYCKHVEDGNLQPCA